LQRYIGRMPDSTAAIEFLARDKPPTVPAVCVIFGGEPFLKRESLEKLRAAVLTGEDAGMSYSVLDGDDVELREVLDELATFSMFGGGRRMVVVEEADKFVTKHRDELEDYVQKPRSNSVLVLEVDSWAANTRLFKRVAESGLQINCNLPSGRFGDVDEGVVLQWLTDRAATAHGAKFSAGAAELLIEIVGPELGRLDQETEKLSLLADGKADLKAEGGRRKAEVGGVKIISKELVESAVGGWRAKTAWAMIELALEGNASEALVQLDRLLTAGEEPIALLAMMGGSLRRLAAAAKIVEIAEAEKRRVSLDDALREAGVSPRKFVLDKAAGQLRQITRQRAKHLFEWLLEADLALKGTSSSGHRARMVLELFIVKLSKQLAPRVPAKANMPNNPASVR
jgi:DNA polymerase-3 subunit delta